MEPARVITLDEHVAYNTLLKLKKGDDPPQHRHFWKKSGSWACRCGVYTVNKTFQFHLEQAGRSLHIVIDESLNFSRFERRPGDVLCKTQAKRKEMDSALPRCGTCTDRLRDLRHKYAVWLKERAVLKKRREALEVLGNRYAGGAKGFLYEQTAADLLGASRAAIQKAVTNFFRVDNPEHRKFEGRRLYDPLDILAVRDDPIIQRSQAAMRRRS